MNHLDTYSPADPSDAEERAYDARIAQLREVDGRALHAAGGDAIDGMLDSVRDILGVPLGRDLFSVPAADTGWDELDGTDRAMWETLATAVRGIAACYLDEELAREIAADAA